MKNKLYKMLNQVQNDTYGQNGRTMVETIAVLAIIGVITIGGIASFQMAMNKMSANKIVEAIGEMSSEAGRFSHNTCINKDNLDDDIEIPECIEVLKGAGNGQVMVTFKDDDDCQEIENAVSGTFAKCKWYAGDDLSDHTYIYVPNRGSACEEEDETTLECTNWKSWHGPDDPCEDFKKASCL